MRYFQYLTFILFLLFTTGCRTTSSELESVKFPEYWNQSDIQTSENFSSSELQNWWKKFNDQNLNSLVDLAIKENSDLKIAQTRIKEAQGLLRTSRSSLFPHFDLEGSIGREDTGQAAADDYHEAKITGSYDLDLFGRNRSLRRAAQSNLDGLISNEQNVKLMLTAEVSKIYSELRANQKQILIAQKNLLVQEKALELIEYRKDVGAGPQLDVERALILVNSTRSAIPKFERLSQKNKNQLAALVGLFPNELNQIITENADIPTSDFDSVLSSPATILKNRPDIQRAMFELKQNTNLKKAAVAQIYPEFNLSTFFGITKNIFVDSEEIWNIGLDTAVSLIDFGRIEGLIDSADALEKQAYEKYRKAVLEAVQDVETSLSNYLYSQKELSFISNSAQSAQKALNISKQLYSEGEISFLDYLDSQQQSNQAEAALVEAQLFQTTSLIHLYRSLGVY